MIAIAPTRALRTTSEPDGTLRLGIEGTWRLDSGLIGDDFLRDALSPTRGIRRVVVEIIDLRAWDSSLIEVLTRLDHLCAERGIPIDRARLPSDVGRLVDLALAVPERGGQSAAARVGSPFLDQLGRKAIAASESAGSLVRFFGATALATWRLIRGRSAMRWIDFVVAFEECGPGAVPITALISVLVGLIMAFIGAAQLAKFGAQLYIANLVGIAMLREMGAIMTAIILAGRTGAAFAANLGTMRLNDEIAALRTVGIDPVEFLALPRVLALTLAMPLLTVFADLLGMLGGMVLAEITLGINWQLYLTQTQVALRINDVLLGLVKSAVFGVIVAVIGCWCGITAEKHAAGVGKATTSAVVLSIVLIIVTDAIFTIVCSILGI